MIIARVLSIFIGLFNSELGIGVPLDTAFVLMALCIGANGVGFIHTTIVTQYN